MTTHFVETESYIIHNIIFCINTADEGDLRGDLSSTKTSSLFTLLT